MEDGWRKERRRKMRGSWGGDYIPTHTWYQSYIHSYIQSYIYTYASRPFIHLFLQHHTTLTRLNASLSTSLYSEQWTVKQWSVHKQGRRERRKEGRTLGIVYFIFQAKSSLVNHSVIQSVSQSVHCLGQTPRTFGENNAVLCCAVLCYVILCYVMSTPPPPFFH